MKQLFPDNSKLKTPWWVIRIITDKWNFMGISFVFIVLATKSSKWKHEYLRHEMIHFRQQREMLVLPFYLWYIVEFLIRWWQHKDWMKAYYNISFEREAFSNQDDETYLYYRKPYSWIKYLKDEKE